MRMLTLAVTIAFVILSETSAPGVTLSSASVTLSLSKGQPAYVNMSALESSIRPQLAAYDREIAALKATQAVPQLSDTRSVVRHQAQVVKDGAAEARATLASLHTNDVQPSGGDYNRAVSTEASNSLSNFRQGLNARVNSAYAAREQQYYEHESQLEINLERASADRRLALQVKLQNLKSPYADRASLKRQIAAIDTSIASKVNALRASDSQALAAYKSQLDARANADYAAMASEMQQKAHANVAMHDRVATQRVVVHGAPKELQQAKFDAAGADISRRFSEIADADDAARGTASNQIIALQQKKAALIAEFRRSAMAIAQSIAQQRGLALVDHPIPGATDITRDVSVILSGASVSP